MTFSSRANFVRPTPPPLEAMRVRFDPEQQGLRQFLPDREVMVLEALWEADGTRTAAELLADLKRDRHVPESYGVTTLTTTLWRMEVKGLVLVASPRSRGRGITFRPRCSHDELDAMLTQRILDALLPDREDLVERAVGALA